jgi:hypothetical protein|tara:strand:- start:11640 stop:12017 length:378 start_codon:yes stop_codon:yes gene_type:complete
MANVRKNPSPTVGTGLPPVTPLEVDRVRRSTLDIVRKQMPIVRQVLDGTREWNNQQVRVFGMLLNKVMPDLHHSFNEHTVENKQVHELTFDELNEIASQAKIVEEDENDTNTTASSETPTEDTGS